MRRLRGVFYLAQMGPSLKSRNTWHAESYGLRNVAATLWAKWFSWKPE